MVKGIGIDIIEIERIRKNVEESGRQFLEKVFTQREIDYCEAKFNKHQHFAARFAAKEAVSKALSTGWAGPFRWNDIEVTNDASGQPHISVSGKLRESLASSSVHVSISHADTHVIAVVLIEDAKS